MPNCRRGLQQKGLTDRDNFPQIIQGGLSFLSLHLPPLPLFRGTLWRWLARFRGARGSRKSRPPLNAPVGEPCRAGTLYIYGLLCGQQAGSPRLTSHCSSSVYVELQRVNQPQSRAKSNPGRHSQRCDGSNREETQAIPATSPNSGPQGRGSICSRPGTP